MEYFDVLDIHRNKINKILPRGSKLEPNEYNAGVEIWIINSNKQLLLTQRSPLKSHPFEWECPGGCVIAGETSREAAVREIKEELGLDINSEKLTFITTSLYKYQFVDIYFLNLNIDISQLTLQKEEVIDASWTSIENFLKINSEKQIVSSVFERYNLIKEFLN